MIIAKEHFIPLLNSVTARALFSAAVDQVEIAISSYCNRVCSYCPNSFVDRRSHRNLMSDELFAHIVRSLQEIGYDKFISLHRYNEPLADIDLALRRIKQIRDALPNAKVRIYTNGDYLKKDNLNDLVESGIAELTITIHEDDFESAKENFGKFLRRVEVGYTITDDTDVIMTADLHVPVKAKVSAKNFRYQFSDGTYLMSSRAGSVQAEGTESYVRTLPCFTPFWDVQIEWDGSMLPCCHIHPDVSGQDRYVLAKLTPETDLFLTWCNDNYASWRRTLFSFEEKLEPCRSCYAELPQDSEQTRTFIREFTKQHL